jgi:protein-S-isoprenylcysteine O-methyltransferase Ste14
LPKLFIAAAILVSIYVSGYLMLTSTDNMLQLLKPYKVNGDPLRNILILSCMSIYFLRLLFTLFVFFQRKLYWGEAIVIANIMPWIFPYIAYKSGDYTGTIAWMELIGIILFLTGSFLNSASEYFRFSWKQKKENAGHLYTGGLFKYTRHTNYFGDIVLFVGLATVAHQIQLFIIPFAMASFFIIVIIPLKENYLRDKYGNEYICYAANTKMLIPYIF